MSDNNIKDSTCQNIPKGNIHRKLRNAESVLKRYSKNPVKNDDLDTIIECVGYKLKFLLSLVKDEEHIHWSVHNLLELPAEEQEVVMKAYRALCNFIKTSYSIEDDCIKEVYQSFRTYILSRKSH